jgi:hypothetical protein
LLIKEYPNVKRLWILWLLSICLAAGCSAPASKSCLAIPKDKHPTPSAAQGWKDLLDEKLTDSKGRQWSNDNGVIGTFKGVGDIFSTKQYGDFILDLEFKIAPKSNSGIFFRVSDTADQVQNGIEIQIIDSWGVEKPGKHDCGAVYDCLAPAANTIRPPGEWNRLTLTAIKNKIYVVMNGRGIIDMDLDRWTTPHLNPDGPPNKFNTAYKDMARKGVMGFQNYGGDPVWYRNIRIKTLD